MKTQIRFSNKSPPMNMEKIELCCFCVLNAVKFGKTGHVCQMISEIYLLLHLLWTGLPPGAITVWLIWARVKKGETSDLHARLNLRYCHGRGKDQPQSNHVPFLSPLINTATNHRQRDRLWYPALLTPTDTENTRHGGKIKVRKV